MQEGKKKGFALGKGKQTKDIKPNQWAESNREVHLDAILALTVDLNVSEHIIDSRPPHLSAPFFSPFGMPSLNFESVRPPCFTPIRPNPLVLPFYRPFGWHCIALALSLPSITREKVDSNKWLHSFEKISTFIHEVRPFQCLLAFFDNFHFNCLLTFTSSH